MNKIQNNNHFKLSQLLHNRRFNHKSLVKLNQYWRKYCQNRTAQGLRIINNSNKSRIKKNYQRLSKFNKILNNNSRDTSIFSQVDDKENILMFKDLSPQAYILICKCLGRHLSTLEVAKIISIGQSNHGFKNTIRINKQIANKIVNRI